MKEPSDGLGQGLQQQRAGEAALQAEDPGFQGALSSTNISVPRNDKKPFCRAVSREDTKEGSGGVGQSERLRSLTPCLQGENSFPWGLNLKAAQGVWVPRGEKMLGGALLLQGDALDTLGTQGH